MEYSGIIESAVEKLCTRLEEFCESRNPIDLKVAFAALSGDVISSYSFGKSYDSLEKPNLDPGLYKNIASGGELALLLKQFPWILNIATLLPYWLVGRLNQNVMAMINRRKVNIKAFPLVFPTEVYAFPKVFNNSAHPMSIHSSSRNTLLTNRLSNRI
jgi:hypothetical protein